MGTTGDHRGPQGGLALLSHPSASQIFVLSLGGAHGFSAVSVSVGNSPVLQQHPAQGPLSKQTGHIQYRGGGSPSPGLEATTGL